MIRDATEHDLPRVLDIANEATLNTTAVWSLTPGTLDQRRAWWSDRTSRGFPVIVIERDGRVEGFGSFGDFRPWEGYLHTVEHSLYVDPSAQGRGAGRALLTALIERATLAGKHVMVAGIETGNAPSISLHLKSGFEHAGTLRQVGRKFDRWLDLTFMQRLLAS